MLRSSGIIIKKHSTFMAGFVIASCFAALVPLPSLGGLHAISFLTYFLIVAVVYAFALLFLSHSSLSVKFIWGFAIIFRLILLFTSPSLSGDVYRFIWDGHLLNQGISPYAHPVNSEVLDIYATPLRDLVNNDWMASPYLPSAQLVFALVEFLIPQNVLGFQLAAVIFDIATAWLIYKILNQLNFPPNYILIYLWNPLVIIEFAHGAHIVDALMIFLIMFTYWLLIKNEVTTDWGVPIVLALATLTKALPVLLLPIFFRRFYWKKLIAYGVAILGISALAATGPGWGMIGPEDGSGLFGAIRIYMAWWNYNSSIYHWLEVGISGYQTPGAVPVNLVGEFPGMLARYITTGILGITCLITLVLSWKKDNPALNTKKKQMKFLLRIAALPIGAYLLLTHTMHPWYVIFIIPFLPFLFPSNQENHQYGWFAIPWLYFSLAIPFSYLTYLDPTQFVEYTVIRWIEYFPLYLLLTIAIYINLASCKKQVVNLT